MCLQCDRSGMPIALSETEVIRMFDRKQLYISAFILALIEVAAVVLHAAR
jgi:hypothetical protein